MLDTCGGHAMPYHYHNDLACDYDHTLPSHSPIIGWALDGYGIYGLYEVRSHRLVTTRSASRPLSATPATPPHLKIQQPMLPSSL